MIGDGIEGLACFRQIGRRRSSQLQVTFHSLFPTPDYHQIFFYRPEDIILLLCLQTMRMLMHST